MDDLKNPRILGMSVLRVCVVYEYLLDSAKCGPFSDAYVLLLEQFVMYPSL